MIVMDFDKVGRNEMIGKIILSSKSGPLETRHWNDMITKPRQQVAQWHLLFFFLLLIKTRWWEKQVRWKLKRFKKINLSIVYKEKKAYHG